MRNGVYNDWRVILPTVNVITIRNHGSRVSINFIKNTCIMRIEINELNTDIVFKDKNRRLL
jgi:hypothetical protein